MAVRWTCGSRRSRFLASLPLAMLALAVLLLGSAGLGRAADDRAAISAHDYRMAGDASRVRVVVEFDREPELKWFLLRAPHRLVIDLPSADFRFAEDALQARGLVTDVLFGPIGEGRSRIILATDGPFSVENLDVLKNEQSEGYRLVTDLVAASEEAFERALADQAQTTGSTVAGGKSDRIAKPEAPGERRFTIVLDPGHGGIDGGAESAGGTVEKSITLDFALELKRELEKSSQFRVVMTRDDDKFLRLDERVRIARQNQADLLISIHADTIRLRGVRGATVYTLSERASDAEAAALAARENLADQLAGVVVEEESAEVADILADLIRRETHSFSIRFARSLIDEMTDKVELINNPLRSAGFRVLRAPDVPSVLVELGYLSNPKDEAQLLDPRWRMKAVTSIGAAVARFAAARGLAGR
jgi:N-acetylmuramoyl-L-alanine amidase